jgi:hypothetical protein
MSAHASRGRAQFLRRDVWTERATNRPGGAKVARGRARCKLLPCPPSRGGQSKLLTLLLIFADSLDQKPAGGLDGASTSSLSPFHHSAIQIHPAIERTQQGAAATRARELERSRARTLRRFYQFQYELYQHSTPFMQLFHSLLRTVMDRKEFCDTLGPVLAFVKIHARLLEQLPELTQYPFGKSKFHDVVHQAFVKVSGFFRKYINNFDRMYQMLTNWKATNAAFCEMLQKGERACKSTSSLGKLDFASLLALPLTCLQVHQEILQQYRLVQEDADDDLERARIDRVLVIISAMCQYADFHGAAGQSVKTLLSIEKKMVQLAAHSSIVGAVVSIVKLGRRTVHIDRLRMLGGSRDEKGEHAIDCTGYLFSDILVCCHGYKGGLVAKCIIDLKKAEIEGCQRYHDPKAPYCLDHTRHNFCIHQLEFNRPHDQKYFGTSDSENLNVWMAKLKDCLSSLAAAGLRSMPLGTFLWLLNRHITVFCCF